MSDKITGVQQYLDIKVCESPSEATQAGYFYRPPIYLPLRVNQVVVVQQATMEGNSTVDFICESESGQKFVFMVTRAMLEMIPK